MSSKTGNILIIDDNLDILSSLTQLLKYDFNSIKTLANPNLIPETIQQHEFDVILLDMNFSAGINTGNEGIFWLREILKIDPGSVIILITAYADISLTVSAIKEGGFDFIVKPWDPQKLITSLKAGVKYRKTLREVRNLKSKQKSLSENLNQQHDPIIGNSTEILELHRTIAKIAPTNANVFLYGENGTGKELIAREIHRKSNRSNAAFISIDMGTISESLFESELFGHTKGSFTDAKEDKMGRIEIASGGTLFLDEITNLSLPLQAKLLTVLQNREVIKVGSSTPIPIDIRLICATNMNINDLISENLFREDLYYRLNTIELYIPPLRERVSDLHSLTDYFIKKFEKKYNKGPFKISQDAISALENHHWPGNIRELKHSIERTIILSESNIIRQEDIFQSQLSNRKAKTLNNIQSLAEIEKETINRALKISEGNLSKASKMLKISRTTLYSKMEKHGL
ncbi:MAG: sigma-54-dependent Fis family transcriptional regulator [Bacteroidetes bacterium HGW-Bacteroidetes-17]|nr:MAG: sigma-54-dependent Fis family transcriptional regulator [Bacteroidetes bacterium HGW-Bacteroidetes-17]